MLWTQFFIGILFSSLFMNGLSAIDFEARGNNLLIALDPGTEGCRKEIQQIDAQIQKLIKQRDAHGQKAAEYQKKGDNWKFESHDVLDAYQEWVKADAEREQMLEIQNQIDVLQARKEWILQFYPQLRTP